MTQRFDYFVIFAGMRTGSNYLERNLNAAPDVRSFGELFNPYFIAHEGQEEYLGLSLADREADPNALVARVRAEATGLAGFRLFHDHDPRMRAQALADPRAAKIVLTRNPLDSFVSYQRALASNQWVLTDAKGQVETDAIPFDPEAFAAFMGPYTAFLTDIRQGLARAGQTALTLRYEDLQDLDVINGALAYLGSRHRLPRPERTLKRQNPEPLETKVTNMEELREAVAALDPFGLDHVPPQPVDRGPAVRSYVACPGTGLLYLPMEGPQPDPVLDWMAALDGCAPADLITGMRQKDLRDWRAAHPDSRTFTLLRHPLARAYTAFVTRILPSDLQSFAELRYGLIAAYKVPLPPRYPAEDLPHQALQKAFRGFLRFLKPNLAAQTSLRIDPSWMAQTTVLQGMAQVALPDRILRDGPGLAEDLRALAAELGRPAPDQVPRFDTSGLDAIHGPELEKLARTAYARDFATFGFQDYRG
ncbi:sulfotransferase domain-containing protein [Dinoroseobacter sp. S375]|uniref:sulfotransferase domain-containing protein n=1 Tax=Dinoroseobacter sp. S375 TaxID=3415136 RepID=UPI003C7A4114